MHLERGCRHFVRRPGDAAEHNPLLRYGISAGQIIKYESNGQLRALESLLPFDLGEVGIGIGQYQRDLRRAVCSVIERRLQFKQVVTQHTGTIACAI